MENSAGSAVPTRPRVLVVDDQGSMREMLVDVLRSMPEFEVVAEAASLLEACDAMRRTRPDAVVLDWVFPGGGGRAFLETMRQERLHSHVLVLTGHTTEEIVREACLAGARGVFEKGGNLSEFLHALRTVAAGGAYFGPLAAGYVQHILAEQEATTGRTAAI